MTTLTPIFIILAFSAISVESIDNKGISSYCEKSRLYSFWYVRTPVECCDHRGQCDKVIGPGETKYGLTNPDTDWSRRHCSCDIQLYECVTEGMSLRELMWAKIWGLRSETCFMNSEVRIGGQVHAEGNQFWSLLDAVRGNGSGTEYFDITVAGKPYKRKKRALKFQMKWKQEN